MKKLYSPVIQIVKILFLTTLMGMSGCSLLSNSLEQAREYDRQAKYDIAVENLDSIIHSDTTEINKAEAFMLRGKAYFNLREYRYAYRDLQVAWKLSCHIYQNSKDNYADAPDKFNTASACINDIPLLIDNLKPYTSDFAAIMATQKASAIVKKLFPDLPR